MHRLLFEPQAFVPFDGHGGILGMENGNHFPIYRSFFFIGLAI
ncbi:hypothetical protein [Haladaptatus sp. CMSO5]